MRVSISNFTFRFLFSEQSYLIGMILLFCTFLALKSQDTANPIRLVEDHLLRGEKPLFAGFETTVTLVKYVADTL